MVEKIRWGILGPGGIAHKFATGLTSVDDAELLAVGSRSQENADRFAYEFAVPRRYASYDALAADPDVDAIYVATPHPFHKANSLLALRAGKAVLTEKPFAISAAEAEEVIALARQKRVFCMEAMWTRFAPAMARIRELLAQGVLGDVRMIQADFGFRTNFNPKGRLFDLALGGGALLDVGIYPVSLASMILGTPTKVVSAAHIGEAGGDEQNALLFSYPKGQIAVLSSAVRTNSPQEAVIMGTEGMIRIAAPWWRPEGFALHLNGKPDEVVSLPFRGNGYEYEAMEVGRCLRASETESKVMPLDETIAILRVMDAIRAEWGLIYPTERA